MCSWLTMMCEAADDFKPYMTEAYTADHLGLLTCCNCLHPFAHMQNNLISEDQVHMGHRHKQIAWVPIMLNRIALQLCDGQLHTFSQRFNRL